MNTGSGSLPSGRSSRRSVAISDAVTCTYASVRAGSVPLRRSAPSRVNDSGTRVATGKQRRISAEVPVISVGIAVQEFPVGGLPPATSAA